MRRIEPLDLTPEEREECVADYLDEFEKSPGTAFHEMICQRKLIRAGVDPDEANYLLRKSIQKRRV